MDLTNLYDPNHIYHGLEAAAEEWTQAQLVADQLEKHGEILLSRMMLEAKDSGNAIGICKEVARARPEWQVHIQGEVIARNAAQRARAKYSNYQALASARQTEESSRRSLTR